LFSQIQPAILARVSMKVMWTIGGMFWCHSAAQ